MMDYSETIDVYDIKTVYEFNQMSTWRYTCTRDDSHSLICVQGHPE